MYEKELGPARSYKSCISDILDLNSAHPRAWKANLIRFGPLSGVFCMFTALVSIIASFSILAASDNQAVTDWSPPPSDYLAIFTAITNLSVRYATGQGVVIAWWTRAMRGSTLGNLHQDWHSGTSLRGALTAGRHLGLLGIACILSTIVIVDGPLLQRANEFYAMEYEADHSLLQRFRCMPQVFILRTKLPANVPRQKTSVNDSVSLNISMAQEIPHGYRGFWSTSHVHFARPFNATIATGEGDISNNIWPLTALNMGSQIGPKFVHGTPLSGVVQGCHGKCRILIKAPALFPNCTSHLLPWGTHLSKLNFSRFNNDLSAPPIEQDFFLIQPFLILKEREKIGLATGYVDFQDACVGWLNYSMCTLEAGIGEYDIQVEHDKINLDSLSPPNLVSFANNTGVNHTALPDSVNPSTLAGIVSFFNEQYSVIVASSLGSNNTPDFFQYGEDSAENFLEPSNSPCPTYRNPQGEMFKQLNKMMFLVGAFAAQEDGSRLVPLMDGRLAANVNMTTSSSHDGGRTVYHSNYWFFAAAAVVELSCLALTAPMYWGWWTIGRPVSFSPLELAKAFDSPILSECNSNSDGLDIAKAMGNSRVKYGATSDADIEKRPKITFRGPELISKPQNGTQFAV